MEAEDLLWKWDDSKSGTIATRNGFRISYNYDAASYTGRVELTDNFGKIQKVWERGDIYADSAFLLLNGDILFIGLFSRSATGCYLIAYDLSSKMVVWERQTPGLGSVGHSRYQNKVQMRMIGNNLCVFGWESDGKYVDVFIPVNGNLLVNKKI